MACSSPHNYKAYKNHNTNNNNNNTTTTITTTSQSTPSTRSSIRSAFFTVSPPDTHSPPCPPLRPSPPEPRSHQCPMFQSHPAPHMSRKWKSWRDYLVEIAQEPALVGAAKGGSGRAGEEEEEEEEDRKREGGGGWRHVSCPDTVAYRPFVPDAEQENAKTHKGEDRYDSRSKGAMRTATRTTAPESLKDDNADLKSNTRNTNINVNVNANEQQNHENDLPVQRFQQTLTELSSLQTRLIAFLSPPPPCTTASRTTTTITPLGPLLQNLATASRNAGRREALDEVYARLISRADPPSHSASKMMLGAAERAILRREAEFVDRLARKKPALFKKMDEEKGKEDKMARGREVEDADAKKDEMKEVEEFVGGLEEVVRDVLVGLGRVLERSEAGLYQ